MLTAMDTQLLTTAGLQPTQAKAYALLLETGEISPPDAAIKLGLSRTNTYKLLDRLVELGLANKLEVRKKFVYRPSNPLALTQLVSDARNRVTHQEEAAKKIMGSLLERYYEKNEQPDAHVATGRDTVVSAFKNQINLQQPIHFIRTRADIASLGFDRLHELRVAPSHRGQSRYGITPDPLHGPINQESDTHSNLTRTWVKQEDYSAPVEWSVSGSILLIVLFGSEPHVITITNPVIADAFRQLWHIMDACLRAMPYYKELPRTPDKQAISKKAAP